MNPTQMLAVIVAAGPVISVITEVLKRLPEVPVNSDNATVVVLGLATIVVLLPAYVGGGLTLENAPVLALSITATFGVGLGAYGLVKTLVAKFRR